MSTKPMPESDYTQQLSRDETFDILSSQRRRSVIHFLNQRGGSVELQEISTQLAAWETGKPIDQLIKAERKRVYTSLRQVHLPVLDENNIIEFDTQQKTVTLAPTANTLDVYFDIVPENDVSWSKYYAGLSGLSVVLAISVLLELYPLTLLPDISWTVFMATAFTISSMAHLYENRQSYPGPEGPPPGLKDN
jgi:hypothetical protein